MDDSNRPDYKTHNHEAMGELKEMKEAGLSNKKKADGMRPGASMNIKTRTRRSVLLKGKGRI